MTALKAQIADLIRATGPITLAQYMQIALGDPVHGYYIKRDPFGRDFTTAPEVSQIFGELIGLFFVQAWEDQGRPGEFLLAELGPGRGTLMADMMRAAAKVRPEFAAAAKIVLVETSPLLRSVQARVLKDHAPGWALRIDELPEGSPLYLVANEFFDALPIRQFVKKREHWHERMVIANGAELQFALAPEPLPAALLPGRLHGAADGAVFELNRPSIALNGEIGRRIGEYGGAELVIDYGHVHSGLGDTLQAMKANAYADPLSEPGETDITAHVDFSALVNTHLMGAAREAEAQVYGPQPQGAFLEALGIGLRAERLKEAAPERAAEIDAAVERLTSPGQMGTLFKALGIGPRDGRGLPGFSC